MKGEEQLTEDERKGPYVVFLEDGRRFEVPAVLYQHINGSGFSHGVKWCDGQREKDNAHRAETELLAVCVDALHMLATMTSERFSRGEDKPIRRRLAAVIVAAGGESEWAAGELAD